MTRMFFTTWILSGLLFWLGWGGYMSLDWGPARGFGVGLIAGILFGICMAGFQVWVFRTKSAGTQMNLPLNEGEQVFWEGPANHHLNMEYRGGWLRLTNRRLAFRPHSVNNQTESLNLPLGRIAGAETVFTRGIIPNGLLVKTQEGVTHRFVVYGRKRWQEAIQSAVKSAVEKDGIR